MQDFENFKYTQRTGKNAIDWVFYGTVDVITQSGFWLWKKESKETVDVFRKYADYWAFVKTGEYTPSDTLEQMHRAWEAQHKCGMEDYVFPEKT